MLRHLSGDRPLILVVGATGKTGRAVVERLRERDWPVRALVRNVDERSERLARLGAQTVAVDAFDPRQLKEAMLGVRRAYFCPIVDPYMIQSAVAFAIAARSSNVEHVVQLSQWLSNPAHPSLLTRQTWLADNLLSMIPGVTQTIVNPGFFADNFLRLVDFASLLGVFPVLAGQSKVAPVSNEDIANVVVAALENPALHAGKSYRPTGPELLSGRDMASILQEVIGHRVRAVDMPLWLFLKAARLQGTSPFELSGFRHYLEDQRRGAFSVGGGVTNVVAQLTGHPAECFRTTATRYVDLPFARRTARNRLRAFFDFVRTPMSPGYDLDQFEKSLSLPNPHTPELSSMSDAWRAEHEAQLKAG